MTSATGIYILHFISSSLYQTTFWILIWNFWRITGSQNGWGWERPLEVIWSKLLLKQGHQQQVAQDHVHMPFQYPKDGDSAVSLGNLCQCSVTLTVKKCFLMFRGNLLCFRLCLWSWHWAPLKRAWLHPICTFPSSICTHWWDPWAFSPPGWAVPALSGFPNRRDAAVPLLSLQPFAALSPVCLCLFCTGQPRTGPSTPPVLNREEGSTPWSCW